jgi:hypothetical protein
LKGKLYHHLSNFLQIMTCWVIREPVSVEDFPSKLEITPAKASPVGQAVLAMLIEKSDPTEPWGPGFPGLIRS